MVVNLWDPGDTGALGANVQILQPTTTGFTPATFKCKGTVGTTEPGASACGSLTGTQRDLGRHQHRRDQPVQRLLADHRDRPARRTTTRPIDPVTGQPGWWKIRYNMSGLATDSAPT